MGSITFLTADPPGGSGSGREVLTANRTYLVATTGNNNNTGLTIGQECATVNGVVAKLYLLDFAGYEVRIEVAAGTYEEGIEIEGNNLIGTVDSGIQIVGDEAAPEDYIIKPPDDRVVFNSGASIAILGLTLDGTDSNAECIVTSSYGFTESNGIRFISGNAESAIEVGGYSSYVLRTDNPSIVVGDPTLENFLKCGSYSHAKIESGDEKLAFTGSPVISAAFITAETFASVTAEDAFDASASGVTGPKYNISDNASLVTDGITPNDIPGDAPGVITTGGVVNGNQIILQGIADDNSDALIPPNCAITSIAIQNTTANAVTGGIKIGTTSGATDVVVAQTVGANALLMIADVDILANIFSTTDNQQLFIEDVVAWNSAELNITIGFTPVF